MALAIISLIFSSALVSAKISPINHRNQLGGERQKVDIAGDEKDSQGYYQISYPVKQKVAVAGDEEDSQGYYQVLYPIQSYALSQTLIPPPKPSLDEGDLYYKWGYEPETNSAQNQKDDDPFYNFGNYPELSSAQDQMEDPYYKYGTYPELSLAQDQGIEDQFYKFGYGNEQVYDTQKFSANQKVDPYYNGGYSQEYAYPFPFESLEQDTEESNKKGLYEEFSKGRYAPSFKYPPFPSMYLTPEEGLPTLQEGTTYLGPQ